jgi:hypothetical protein
VSSFKPVGETARWRTLYDLLRSADVNGVLTYEAMAQALALHPETDRHVIQMAMRRAARELETVDKHAVTSLRNVGYRVVRPDEHVILARGQQRRSTRALARGHSKVVNVDLNGLSPEVRQLTEATMRAFSMQLEFNRRTDVRQRRLEDAIATMGQRADRTQEELDAIQARLTRLEGAD